MNAPNVREKQKIILFFVKFFSEKKYAHDFIRGNVYASRLSYFKDIEGTDDSGRADRHEGAIGWFQPNQGRLTINEMDITGDLAGPVEMQREWLNYRNLFCVHAAHTGDIELDNLSSDNVEDLRKQLELSQDCLRLGMFAVVIKNIPAFMNRIESAVKEKGYRLSRGLVKYYDPETFHGSFSDWDAVFRKRNEFRYQQEYRFVIDTRVIGDWPIVLEIGDIGDITSCFHASKINRELLSGEIKFPS